MVRNCRNKKVCGDPNLCENCKEASIGTLRYTCQSCHRVQTIPHPIWKSQKTAKTETEQSWMCYNVDCYENTHWVVVEEDIAKIPEGLAPWAQQD